MKKLTTHNTPPTTLTGFTLLEIMVVVGIMLTLTGFAVSNYNNFNRLERLRQAAKTIKTDIRFIQTRASSGVKPSSGCPTLAGYQLSFTASTYTYVARCANAIGGAPFSAGTATTMNLPQDITFSPIPSPIVFEVLTGRIASDVTITLTSVSRTSQITVSRSGDVNDLGLN